MVATRQEGAPTVCRRLRSRPASLALARPGGFLLLVMARRAWSLSSAGAFALW